MDAIAGVLRVDLIASPSLMVKNKSNYWQKISTKNTNIMLMAERLK